MADIDPDIIIDLGKTRQQELNDPAKKEMFFPATEKVFFPGMSLEAGLIPGEVGTKTFLKVMVEKTSASKKPGKDNFDIMNMRILGSADKKKAKAKDQTFDESLEIVIQKKEGNTEHEGE